LDRFVGVEWVAEVDEWEVESIEDEIVVIVICEEVKQCTLFD